MSEPKKILVKITEGMTFNMAGSGQWVELGASPENKTYCAKRADLEAAYPDGKYPTASDIEASKPKPNPMFLPGSSFKQLLDGRYVYE